MAYREGSSKKSAARILGEERTGEWWLGATGKKSMLEQWNFQEHVPRYRGKVGTWGGTDKMLGGVMRLWGNLAR